MLWVSAWVCRKTPVVASLLAVQPLWHHRHRRQQSHDHAVIVSQPCYACMMA